MKVCPKRKCKLKIPCENLLKTGRGVFISTDRAGGCSCYLFLLLGYKSNLGKKSLLSLRGSAVLWQAKAGT